MSRYLISTQETYRVDTEAEAQQLINEAKAESKYVLSKYSTTQKDVKQKGQIVETYYKTVLTKVFDSEKEPVGNTKISYEADSAF
jgi:hypothetical protein